MPSSEQEKEATKIQTHVFIPATIEQRRYISERIEMRQVDCTIIAFVGVGSSNNDGSYNRDIMAVAMFADGRTVTELVTAFTILPAADLAPVNEVL